MREVPDFRETFELPHGMFRRQIPIYDERVVRELLVNALVHRPYTQRGDIFLNLHPDRLQIVNPGLLPLGVTPQNILHQSVRRNDEMGRVFHDLGLMEREGSGYDMLYEVLTSQGRALPVVREGFDRVEVTVPRRVVKPEVIDFLAKADEALSPDPTGTDCPGHPGPARRSDGSAVGERPGIAERQGRCRVAGTAADLGNRPPNRADQGHQVLY